jgi:hypothetical protein
MINETSSLTFSENFMLRFIFEEIQNTIPSFNSIYFHHVIRERIHGRIIQDWYFVDCVSMIHLGI